MGAAAMSQKLFIIHGWSYNLDKWQKVVPLLQKQGFEPILLKVPGLTEPSDKVWDINGYIDWLDDKLKSEDQPVVVGHSNGGRIALAYLQKHPGRFQRLILIDAAGLPHNGLVHVLKLKILYILAKIGKPISRIPILRKVFYKVIGAQDYNQAPPNMRETMNNMFLADKTIDLAAIKVSTTMIWGEDDTITPLTDGRKMHRLLKNSDLHVVEGARHAPMDTHPQQVADAIGAAVKS